MAHQTSFPFRLDADINIEYKETFYVLPTIVTDVILRLTFLERNNACINLKERLIFLKRRSYEIPTNSDSFHEIDHNIMDNTKICMLDSAQLKTTCEKQILNYKLTNPELGT